MKRKFNSVYASINLFVYLILGSCLMLFAACKMDKKVQPGVKNENNILITIKYDANVKSVKNAKLYVENESEFSSFKNKIEPEFKDGFELCEYRFNDESGSAISDNYVFEKDTDIFIASQVETPKVLVTFKHDENITKVEVFTPHPAGSSLKPNQIRITAGSSVISAVSYMNIEYKSGYGIKEWRLNDKNGAVQDSNAAIKVDTVLYGVSAPTRRVTVLGDSNVIVDSSNPSFNVTGSVMLKDIKNLILSKIKDYKTNYKLGGFKLNNESGEVINDDSVLCESGDAVIYVYSDSLDKNLVLVTPPTSPIIGMTPPDVPRDSDGRPDPNGVFNTEYPMPMGLYSNKLNKFLPEVESYHGVFFSGRDIKLSPYFISKFEMHHKEFTKVYKWAISNKYKFKKDYNLSGSDVSPVSDIYFVDAVIWCNAYTEYLSGSTDECVYRYKRDEEHEEILKEFPPKGVGDQFALKDVLYADISKTGYRLPTEAEWEYAARWQPDNSNGMAVKLGDVWMTKLNTLSGSNKVLPLLGIPIPSGESNDIIYKPSSRTIDYSACGDTISLAKEAARAANINYWYDQNKLPKDADGKIEISDMLTSLECQLPFELNIGSSQLVVGSKHRSPNALGLYDMSGNVSEYCYSIQSDVDKEKIITCDHSKYNKIVNGAVIDPVILLEGSFVIARGGSLNRGIYFTPVGYRQTIHSYDEKQAGLSNLKNTGFRVVRTLGNK